MDAGCWRSASRIPSVVSQEGTPVRVLPVLPLAIRTLASTLAQPTSGGKPGSARVASDLVILTDADACLPERLRAALGIRLVPADAAPFEIGRAHV